VRLHTLARKSIARFAGSDQRVEVWFREHGGIQRCRPEASIFWALRAWDAPSERKTKSHVEDRFQEMAELILRGKRELSSQEQGIITQFQQLWALRVALREYPRADLELPSGLPRGPDLTRSEQENLEANGYSFATGGRLLGAQLGGLMIAAGLLRSRRSEAANIEWSVFTSSQIEFLVPDSFRTVRTVPLSPNCCLMANAGGPRKLLPLEAMHLNNIAARQCVRYSFARDFSSTGVTFLPSPAAQ